MRAVLAGFAALMIAAPALAYPIDAWKDTGINRLEAYRLALGVKRLGPELNEEEA